MRIQKLLKKTLTAFAVVSAFTGVNFVSSAKAENTNANYGYVTPVLAHFTSPVQVTETAKNEITATIQVDLYGTNPRPAKVYLVNIADPSGEENTQEAIEVKKYFDVVSEIKEVTQNSSVTFDNVKILYKDSVLHCYYELVGADLTQPGNKGYCGPFVNEFKPERVNTLNVTYTGNETPLFRFWSEEYKGHFYTPNRGERYAVDKDAPNNIWNYEGIAYFTNSAGTTDTECTDGKSAVYRFFNAVAKHHFYTMNAAEKDALITQNGNWKYEGAAYCASENSSSNTMPVYRFFSESRVAHFFTTSEAEKNHLISNDPNWRFEDVAYYVEK